MATHLRCYITDTYSGLDDSRSAWPVLTGMVYTGPVWCDVETSRRSLPFLPASVLYQPTSLLYLVTVYLPNDRYKMSIQYLHT